MLSKSAGVARPPKHSVPRMPWQQAGVRKNELAPAGSVIPLHSVLAYRVWESTHGRSTMAEAICGVQRDMEELRVSARLRLRVGSATTAWGSAR
jgi:hypothetical protein